MKETIMSHLGVFLLEDIMLAFEEENSSCDSDIHQLFLPLLLTKEVRNLNFLNCYQNDEENPFESVTDDILFKTLSNCGTTNLSELDATREFCFDDVGVFKKVLLNTPLLKILRFLTTYCIDDYLEIVGCTCSCLQELHIDCYEPDLNYGFMKLCFCDFPENTSRNRLCNSLKVFCFQNIIFRTGIHIKKILVLLVNLPNLQSLGDYIFTGQALCLAIEKGIEFSQNICYFSQDYLNLEILNTVSIHCENIQKLSLNSPDGSALQMLHLLRNVKSISIENNTSSEIYTYLANHGKKLETIIFEYGRFTNDELDIYKVGCLCPKLCELKLLNCRYTKLVNMSSAIFNNLQNLNIGCESSQDNHDDLVTLLSKLPIIQEIYIKYSNLFTNEDILEIIRQNPFLHLQKLELKNCSSLSTVGIDVLIEHCPKLEFLGNIEESFSSSTSRPRIILNPHQSGGPLSKQEALEYKKSLAERNLAVKVK